MTDTDLREALAAFGARLAADGYGWEAIITREGPRGEETVAHLTTANPDPATEAALVIPEDAIGAIRSLPYVMVDRMTSRFVALDQVVGLLKGWLEPRLTLASPDTGRDAGLDELRALSEAATPGPWVDQQPGDNDPGAGTVYIDTHAYPEGPEPVIAPPNGYESLRASTYPLGIEDAAFIVAAVNYVRARLTESPATPDAFSAWCECGRPIGVATPDAGDEG